MNFYDFVFGKGKAFLMTLLFRVDLPDTTPTPEELEKEEYLIRIPVPNSESTLKVITKIMVAIIHGMLLHCCRDTSNSSCVYIHTRLTIVIKCNGLCRTIVNENAAIPSGGKELADYLAKFDSRIESKISSLLVAATLPLVDGDNQ